MRTSLALLAATALPLAACATSPYGYGYGSNGYGSYGANNYGGIIGALGGSLGGAYGSSFNQAAISACAGTASRYGRVGVRDVRQLTRSTVKVFGYVGTGYNSRNWDCTFRSDGRITDFDI